jgi:ABC-type dipeptide/oligopeptide/nickel transport system permease component
VVTKHALRNAAIPVLTLLGLQAGQLMGGAVLTETVFAWPGLGRLMVKAIFARDYVLLQGAVLLFSLAFVLINLLVDLSYGALDPRVSKQG